MLSPTQHALWTGAATILGVAMSPALAHDFWISLSDYHAERDQRVEVSLRVGHADSVTHVPRRAGHCRSFRVVGDPLDRPIGGVEGDEPAGFVRLSESGLYLLGYRSNQSFIELDAAEFEAYLAEEGLDVISRERARLGQSDEPGRETYSRCAKSMLRVGDAAPDGRPAFDRTLGFPLEFIPEADPLALSKGDRLTVRLLYESQPLVGALVDASHREREDAMPTTHSAITDGEGRATFTLDHAGEWVIAATHMVEAAPDAEADWESLWASLTFAIERPDERELDEPVPAEAQPR